jgi:hypothetical protein
MILSVALALAAAAFVEGCSTRSKKCDARNAAITPRAVYCGMNVVLRPYIHTHPLPAFGQDAIVTIQDAVYFAVVLLPSATLAQLNCLKDKTAPSPIFAALQIEKRP